MVYRLIKFEPEPEERAFFAGFPGFPQDPGAPVSTEFARLAAFRHWASGSKTWKKNWNICMAAEYDRLIGSRIASPRSWRELCAKVGLDGSLPSIRQCRMVGLSFLLLSFARLTVFCIGTEPCQRQHY